MSPRFAPRRFLPRRGARPFEDRHPSPMHTPDPDLGGFGGRFAPRGPFAEPGNWSLTGVSSRDVEEGLMGGILTLLVIVYLVGIGVVLAPTVQGQWNTGTASEFVGKITGVAGGGCVAGDPLSSHDGSVTRVGVSIKSRWASTTTPSPAGGSRRCSFRRGRASTEAGRRTRGRARCGFARRGPAATHLPSLARSLSG